MAIFHQLFLTVLLSFSSVLAKEDCTKNTREDRCSAIFDNITNCNVGSYHPQLMECLVTCGKCDAFTCNNPQAETVLNCTALATQCNSTVWGRFMKEKCPATCGKCDVKNANLCKDASDSVLCSKMVVRLLTYASSSAAVKPSGKMDDSRSGPIVKAYLGLKSL
ncbi:shTK domain protein [Teladorsagia circumcincta]|uniref:ShTK domain protein n=1 Tax=Teladorsagia circumcincta TaxID=45464 RepID=A0A2G9V204_TELCI|nr:shTK domain protein [Teladorsagia circumcincta]